MAATLGISPAALGRWTKRKKGIADADRAVRGRPAAIPAEARVAIRSCYEAHYGQWGPQVLAAWCRREALGEWSASTISAAIADLRVPEPPAAVPRRYEVTAADVMWSEDGTAFRRAGRKRELLVVHDEHARKKLNWSLATGPAQAADVCRYLEAAFRRYGAPLVLKHDGAGIFREKAVAGLLKQYGVVELTAPPHWPGYNGKQERSMRDVKSYERALRRHGVKGGLSSRIAAAMQDLNDERPRPVLGGRTASEAYRDDRVALPDRTTFRKEVISEARVQRRDAATRRQRAGARRRAVEVVLLRHGLLAISGDVSLDFTSGEWTD